MNLAHFWFVLLQICGFLGPFVWFSFCCAFSLSERETWTPLCKSVSVMAQYLGINIREYRTLRVPHNVGWRKGLKQQNAIKK